MLAARTAFHDIVGEHGSRMGEDCPRFAAPMWRAAEDLVCIPGFRYSLEVYEYGGGTGTGTGEATVVCNRHGHALTPLNVWYAPEAAHARFLGEELHTVTVSLPGPRQRATFRVMRHTIANINRTLMVEQTLILRGNVDPSFPAFRDAIRAAHEKTQAPGCARPMYIFDPAGNFGPRPC